MESTSTEFSGWLFLIEAKRLNFGQDIPVSNLSSAMNLLDSISNLFSIGIVGIIIVTYPTGLF